MKITYVAIILLLSAGACGPLRKISLGEPRLRYLESCGELIRQYRNTKSEHDVWNRRLPVSMAAEASGAGGSTIVGNPQTPGVEEGDVVKLSARYLYYFAGNFVQVMRRSDRQPVTAIATPGLDNVHLFVRGERLWIIGNSQNSRFEAETVIRSFREGASGGMISEPELRFRGNVMDTRVANGKLIVALRSFVEERVLPQNPSRYEEVTCTKLSAPLMNDNDWRVVKLFSLSLDEAPRVLDSTGLVGSGGLLYMSDANIYVVKDGSSLCGWSGNCAKFEGTNAQKLSSSSFVSKVRFDGVTGNFRLEGMGTVPGWVKDSWALQEYREGGVDSLSVATTYRAGFCNSSRCAESVDVNRVFILEPKFEQLVVRSETPGFGHREDIRSVRYVDRMAYVVTFQKTDPLWAISLADLSAPRILGELEVPGFSTYLHPLPDGRLLGVGLDATAQGDFALLQGVQLSLFDVRDPLRLRRDDHSVFGGRGSFSHASSDRHAFYYDANASLVGLPLVEFNAVPDDSRQMGQQRLFSGARFFEVNERAGRLSEVASVSHADMVPETCLRSARPRWGWEQGEASIDVQRILQIDGKIVTLSPYGVKDWSRDAQNRLTPISARSFNNVGDWCAHFGATARQAD